MAIHCIEKKENILRTFLTALAVDTQSAAIAQTCFYYNTPYAIIRAISDQADGNALQDYKMQIEKTAQQSCNIVLNILCQKQQLLRAS